ncbi:MAG: NADH:ubiquinone oxidoreductase [Paracoccaceae bacterium]|nr:NADH:ubiquinone oxidoreductase [Paracoccaceae bacterium]
MSKQTQSSMLLVGVLSGGIGFMAFLVLLVIGGFDFNQSLFLALLLALVVALFLFFAFHRPADAPGASSAALKHVETPAARAPEPAPAPQPAPAPAPAPDPVAAEPAAEGTRPAALDGPREGGADDLKKIKGVGPKLENLLHSMGFYHFDQVAAWTDAEVAWVDENLEGFKGRVSRDNWVEQAKLLASGGETEFSKKVGEGDVY